MATSSIGQLLKQKSTYISSKNDKKTPNKDFLGFHNHFDGALLTKLTSGQARNQTCHCYELLTFLAVVVSVQFIFLCFYHFWRWCPSVLR